MSAAQVQEALAQIKELRRNVMDRQQFRGYSGVARAAGGTLALVTAAVLAKPRYATDPQSKRDPRRLAPVFGVLPPFLVTCALTIAMVLRLEFRYLFGLWMCGYGLMHLSQNLVLPRSIRLLGLYYIACGVLVLLVFRVPFTNPWPMGFIFFAGEWIGGIIFIRNRMPEANWYEIVFHKNTGV